MSLMWILRIVAFFAVSCAALARPSAPWLAATVTALFALVIMATIQSFSNGRDRRFAIGFTVAAWVYVLLLIAGAEHMLVTTWISQRCHAMATGQLVSDQDYSGVRRIEGGQVIFVSSQQRREAEAFLDARLQGGVMGGPGMMGAPMGMGMGMGGPMGGGLSGGMGGGMDMRMMPASAFAGGAGYGAQIPSMDAPALSSFARYMHITHCMWAVVWAVVFGMVSVRGIASTRSKPSESDPDPRAHVESP